MPLGGWSRPVTQRTLLRSSRPPGQMVLTQHTMERVRRARYLTSRPNLWPASVDLRHSSWTWHYYSQCSFRQETGACRTAHSAPVDPSLEYLYLIWRGLDTFIMGVCLSGAYSPAFLLFASKDSCHDNSSSTRHEPVDLTDISRQLLFPLPSAGGGVRFIFHFSFYLLLATTKP